jgi:hypothetical protein
MGKETVTRVSPEERARRLAEMEKLLADPIPLDEYPWIVKLKERIPCTLAKELPQRSERLLSGK